MTVQIEDCIPSYVHTHVRTDKSEVSEDIIKVCAICDKPISMHEHADSVSVFDDDDGYDFYKHKECHI